MPEKESFIIEAGRFQGHIEKDHQGVCTSTVMVCPDPLFPIPLPLKNMKIPENTEDSYDPKPVGEGDIQMKYSSQLCSPSFRTVTIKLPV